jgi:hypothetical protein
MAEINHEKYKKAFRELTINDGKKGFKSHLTSFIIMNTILVIINISTYSGTLWCLGSIIGWGVGVIAHYIGGIAILNKKLLKMEAEAETIYALTHNKR